MRTRRLAGVIMGSVVLGLAWTEIASAQMHAGGAISKLGRGAVNIATGWVEIPKRIYETAQAQGTAAGLTWGLLRGLGHGFIRTAAGCYEVVTFPFPAPPDYTPVIEPEFVFTQEDSASSTKY